ncbi:MAG: fimbria major subunit [Barnesiella sp.]|nr:fimbria major subunit [Barnesiella sp.]
MKIKSLYAGSFAVIMLASCSDDVLVDGPQNGNNIVENDQTFYVSMNIKGDSDSQSRAAGDNGTPSPGDDFEDGTPNSENQINNAYFVFYDEDGNVVGDIVPVELDDSHLSESITENSTVERSYKSVVPVSVKKGEKKPAQVICYINPISPSTLQNPLSVIQTISRTATWSTIGGGATKYFAMSNSVYYPRSEGATTGLAPNDGLPQVAVPIPETYLYTSEQAAEDALGTNNTLNIYVERYASKLSFKAVDPTNYVTATRVYDLTSDNPTSTTGSTTKLVTLSFVPQYWAVNAESTRTYVIKSFRQESESGEVLANNYAFGNLNARINPATYVEANNSWDYSEGANVLSAANRWAWNNPDLHRSFWGMSPAYFTAEYPEVSSDLKDLTVNQKYISYNELKDNTNGIGFAANNTAPQYFRETTVSYRGLNSKNPNAAVASVIYVGQYKLNLDGTDLPEGTSFYTYLSGNVPSEGVTEDRPYIYFNTSNGIQSAVPGGESMLLRFFAQSTILYRKSATDEEKAAGEYTRLTIANESDRNMMLDALRVSEISDFVKQQYDGNNGTVLKLQNNARSLQFTSAQDADGIYIVTGGGYMQIVPDNTPDASFDENTQIRLTDANVALMRQVGLSYYYTTGHAYYSIPVKHFGWYRNGNEQKNATKIDWNRVRVGDFGMVRNHSYQMNVTEIVGLATGIGDDDTPIVPPSTTEDYFMAYSVNILKWAVVPEQNVQL